MMLSEAAQAVSGQLIGHDVQFSSVNTDTRTLRKNDLFVALKGPNFNGHTYLDQAGGAGAVAAIVSQNVESSLPLIQVADTRLALGQLASVWRQQFSIPVVAITGSNGKTTVKEMLGSILARRHQILVTKGNLNNDIGVPLTLLRLIEGHQFAVIEIGANHPGEIDYLARLTKPTVAVITNAAPAHLEGFGNIEGVVKAKGEIFMGLDVSGIAVINVDDQYRGLWQELASQFKNTSFGIRNDADVRALNLEADNDQRFSFELATPIGTLPISLKLTGQHSVMNALAASAAALSVGAALEDIKHGLELMQPVVGRLTINQGINNIYLIDDTYNANPASLESAIELLIAQDRGLKVLVLGEMGELGKTSAELHRQAGSKARSMGVDRLFTLGKLAGLAAKEFGEAGHHFSDHDALISALKSELSDQGHECTVLVKGSRMMRMESVVDALTKVDAKHSGATESMHHVKHARVSV